MAARLNGNPLTEPFFTHEDIVAGGILEFDMGVLLKMGHKQ